MKNHKIIVFAGLPFTGKSSLAKLLEKKLKITRLDIDEIRHLIFKYNKVDSEKDRERDDLQMLISWQSLFALTNYVVEAGLPVIIVGTFSKKYYHEQILSISKFHKVPLKIIYCFAPDAIIARRIKFREHRNPSNIRTMDGYRRVRSRYQKIIASDPLDINTSKPIYECLAKIIDFVGR